MAKNLKLNIKNAQIAEAVNLSNLKNKLTAKKKTDEKSDEEKIPLAIDSAKDVKSGKEDAPKEETPRIRARSKSAFAESHAELANKSVLEASTDQVAPTIGSQQNTSSLKNEDEPVRAKTSAEIRRDIFGEDSALEKQDISAKPEPMPTRIIEEVKVQTKAEVPVPPPSEIRIPTQEIKQMNAVPPPQVKKEEPSRPTSSSPYSTREREPRKESAPYEKLGPTGRHVKDFIKPKPVVRPPVMAPLATPGVRHQQPSVNKKVEEVQSKPRPKEEEIKLQDDFKKGPKTSKFKEFKDIKPAKKQDSSRFDARDRQGLRASDEEQWRKRRKSHSRIQQEEVVTRPTSLSIRTPISIKDLASEMKLKSSQLVGKLFLQGLVVTLNDMLEDETTLQLLGNEFGCDIRIDKTKEKRIRITDQTIKEELQTVDASRLIIRPPVVAFMGHVDHGKTSLIDYIRKSNRAAGEAGAITQHIGAFCCSTAIGNITVLDTPGHEAFSAMRARGADVTDIVVLVVAGDEGLRQQSIEAIQHAKAANVIIVVAINKSDKPNFNADTVYRQLAEQELLPETWGGQTITINCSATTGQGVPELLEMLALQAEILELTADPNTRARGTVLESELHKGLGHVATVLVQNGTLRRGDAVVFGQHWGRIKNMHDEHGRELDSAPPSTPVEITGLSGLPDAGQEFIVVKNEREAREISDIRSEGARQTSFSNQQKKKVSMENLFQQASATSKKILNIILRADVQGSLEAIKVALLKIHSDKADLNIVFAGVGEITESDVQLAAASKAVIIGFHTQIESHAESLIKQLGVQIRLHDIIYHAIDEAKDLMSGLLDKIAIETEKGKVLVKATFKSSHTGIIAGCQVIEGSIHRNSHIRLKRGLETVWKGSISSLKRVKEDVKEVQKGLECGIILNNFTDIREGDILEAYEITYISQEL